MARHFASLVICSCAWVRAVEGGALRGALGVDAQAPLVRALSESGGAVEVEERLAYLIEAMRPAFLALPRSPEGYLEASAVRYLLHRYFVDRDGWFVQGREGSGESADDSLPKAMLGGDGALADALSQRLSERGLSLREAAVLAMGLETLASKETEDRLHAVYRIMHLSHREDHATEAELDGILQNYLIIYIGTYDHESMSRAELWAGKKNIYDTMPNWDQFREWFGQVRSEVLASIPHQDAWRRSAFDGQVRVLEEFQHRFGRWSNEECLSIKKGLLEYATPGTGRVRLNAFYTASLPGGWLATETKEYLREIGALDESDPADASVVVPNYFETPSNCANSSKYYSICCISECEAILGDLERKLGSPNALPQQIVQIVENLSSPTVEAPRTLSAQLVQRLEGVAALHGGHVPLHGRLFRQWIHHAFPAECSFPGLSMTKNPRTPDEFLEQTGRSAMVSPDLLNQYAEEHATEGTQDPQELPWSDEEELFVVCRADQPAPAKLQRKSSGVLRSLLFVAMGGSMMYMLVQTATSTKSCVLPVHSKVSMA